MYFVLHTFFGLVIILLHEVLTKQLLIVCPIKECQATLTSEMGSSIAHKNIEYNSRMATNACNIPLSIDG